MRVRARERARERIIYFQSFALYYTHLPIKLLSFQEITFYCLYQKYAQLCNANLLL